MPLITITGLPLSYKTTRATELIKYLSQAANTDSASSAPNTATGVKPGTPTSTLTGVSLLSQPSAASGSPGTVFSNIYLINEETLGIDKKTSYIGRITALKLYYCSFSDCAPLYYNRAITLVQITTRPLHYQHNHYYSIIS